MGRAGINGESDGRAAQAQGVLDRTGEGGEGVLFVLQDVVVVDFENERDVAGKFAGGGFEGAERSGVGVAAGSDGQFHVITGIVAGGIDGETAGRAVFKSLVHREDDHAPGAAESAVVEEAAQVGQRSRVVTAVPTQYFFNS